MAHQQNRSIILRSQETAKSSQCLSVFCLPHVSGTWLPLPELAAINTTVELTPSGEFHTFLHFIVQVEANLQHLLSGLDKVLLFLNSFAWISFKIDLCAKARK